MTTPIPKERLEAARRKVKRQVAAMLVYAMAEADMTFEQIAEVLGDEPGAIRKYVHDLIDGVGQELNALSDLCLALDREPAFSIRPIPKAAPPATPSE